MPLCWATTSTYDIEASDPTNEESEELEDMAATIVRILEKYSSGRQKPGP